MPTAKRTEDKLSANARPTTMTEKDNILRQMASYAFTAPVNATIIFEDSDEENNTFSVNAKVAIDDTKTKNGKAEPGVASSHKTVNEARSLPIIDIEPIDQGNNNRSITLLEEFLSFSNNKINKSTPNREQLKRKTQEQELILNKAPKRNEVNNNTARVMEQNQCEQQIIHQALTPQANNITNPYLASVGYANTNQLTSDFRELSTYVITLLNNVSEHMILIMKSYYEHKMFEKNCGDNFNVIEKSRMQFTRVKYHYFNLSYCTVIAIMLPQDGDAIFIQNFLDNTIKIGRKKGLIYDHQQLVTLYNELILWTKGKKRYLATVSSGFTVRTDNTRSNQNVTTLSTSSAKNGNVEVSPQNNTPKNKNNTPSIRRKSCNMSSGPPTKEISRGIKLSPSTQSYSKQVSLPPYMPSSSTREIGEQMRQNSTYAQKAQNNLTGFNYQSHANPDRTTKTSTGISQLTGVQEMYPQNTTRPNSYAQCSSTSKVSYQGVPWTNHSYTQPQYYNNCQQILGSSQLQSLFEMQIPLDSNRPSNQMDNAISSYQTDNTRSVSRDSGFISPPIFNINIDQAITHCIEEERNQQSEQQVTPLITHVTSLNPQARQIAYGLCEVCGKITKTKCLGCYQTYYCSNECQKSDWLLHMVTCKGARC